MTYESPIEISNEITQNLEDYVMTIVQKYGVIVNKEELKKALQYDRDQYAKGYADGQRAGERIAKVTYLEMSRNPKNIIWKCENCGQYMHRTLWSSPVNYCSRCGCRLEWK